MKENLSMKNNVFFNIIRTVKKPVVSTIIKTHRPQGEEKEKPWYI